MSARFKRLASAATNVTEHALDIEMGKLRIQRALADGFQPEDIPEILAACGAIEDHVDDIKAELKEIGEVEMDIDVACRVLNVGRADVWDKRFQARERRMRQDKAPTRLHAVRAQKRGNVA
jgi:hypothetical protein